MPEEPSEIYLNENHRRSLASALRQVERSLESFTHQLANIPYETPGKNAEVIARTQQRINETLRLVNELRERFGIDDERRADPLWSIRVGVSLLWEMLEDCKSSQLKGYGELPPNSQFLLDRDLEELIRSLNEIAHSVE